tara:strand:- start:258 stop:593 length:336 start_codon:yes stop_codon:yes gene_type:complete
MSLTLLPTEDDQSFLHAYEFEPGNGTRYHINIGRDSTGKYLLAWLHRGGSGGACFSWDGSYVHSSYLKEKLGNVLMGDVYALCALLTHFNFPAQLTNVMESRKPYLLNPLT